MSIAQRYRAVVAGQDAGFSLVEVIVAFMVFGIVASAATLAVTNGMTVSNASRLRVTAANVAQQQLAIAQAMTPSQLASSTAPATVTVGQNTYGLTRTVCGPATATVACPSPTAACPTVTMSSASDTTPHYLNVTVTVTSPGTAARTVTTRTVIAC